MPKTKRLTTYYGATLNPAYRFIRTAKLRLSPFDANGNKVARCLYVHFSGGDARLKLPDFKMTVEVDHTIKNSCLEAEYRLLSRERVEKHFCAQPANFPADNQLDEGLQRGGGELVKKVT